MTRKYMYATRDSGIWRFLIVAVICAFPSLIYAQNAPVTTAQSQSACPNATITVPLTVTGFSQITAISLRLDFDPTLLNYTGFANPNTALAGCIVNSVNVTPNLQKLILVWTNINPLSLPNGSKLLDLNFTFISGSPTLSFNNTDHNGGDCEYADATGNPMNDLPTDTYYINAAVTNLGVAGAGNIAGSAIVCQSQLGAAYSVEAITNASSYIWTIPAGASISSGNTTNTILIDYSPTAISGFFTVQASNICGSGPVSDPFAVTVDPLPGTCGAIAGPITVCQNAADIYYSIAPVANALAYTWVVPTGWTITDGQNTDSITVNSGGAGGIITVTPVNNCSYGAASTLTVLANLPPMADAGPDQTIPLGAATVLNGAANGGAGPYTWHWEPSNLLVDPETQNPITISLSSSALFNLVVTDANGCTGNDNVLVIVSGYPLSANSMATPDTLCVGGMVQLLAVPGGGNGNYSFSWSSIPDGFNSVLQSPTDYPVVTTTYVATVTDGNDTVTDSVTVFVKEVSASPEMPNGPDTVDVANVESSLYSIPAVAHSDYYDWELNPLNAGILVGSDIEVSIWWNPVFLGFASVKARSLNECGSSIWSVEKLTFVDNTTGLNIEDIPVATVFPNPNNGHFFIKSPLPIIRMVIYNSKGETMSDILNPDQFPEFEYRLPSGIYIVKIVARDRIFLERISIVSKE